MVRTFSYTSRLIVPAVVLAILSLTAVVIPAAASSARLVKDINPNGSSRPNELVRVGPTLYFVADDGVHGRELWKSDGSSAGTVLVKDIKPGAIGSNPEALTNVAGTLFFLARDGFHGRELWKSDGTDLGTSLVADIKPGPNSPTLFDLTAVGSRLFFVRSTANADAVWTSDGTAAGTHRVHASSYISGHKLVSFAGQAWFSDYFCNLWRTDGVTTAETKGSWCGFGYGVPTVAGRRLFFGPNPLYRTDVDGSPVKQLAQLDTPVLEAVSLGSRILFITGDFFEHLWVSDGTVAGTRQIYDIGRFWNPWLDSPVGLLRVGNYVYVTTNTEEGPPHPKHLYRTDGTTAGTVEVAQTYLMSMANVGGTICYTGGPGPMTWSLWCLANNTTPYWVAYFTNDPNAGYSEENLPREVIGGRLYFPANDDVHGTELWSYRP